MSEALISAVNIQTPQSGTGSTIFGNAVKVYILTTRNATFNIGYIPTHCMNYCSYGFFVAITPGTEVSILYGMSSNYTLRLTMDNSGIFTIGSATGNELIGKYLEVTFLI